MGLAGVCDVTSVLPLVGRVRERVGCVLPFAGGGVRELDHWRMLL